MNKTLLRAVGVLFGILIVVFAVLSLSLDGIVKSRIQETGTILLKTEVTVDNLSLSVFDGKGTVDEVIIRNPDKFENRPAVAFRQIRLEIDLATLFSDTVVVKRVVISEPEFYAEQTLEGNNLKTLRDNLANAPSESSSRFEGNLVVDHLVVESGRVTLTSKIGEERTVQAEIGRIELTGIGRNGNNTVEATARQILEPVLEQAIRSAVREGVLDAAEGELRDILSN